MRSKTGPQWLISHEVSWEVNFLLWLRQQPDGPSGLSPRQWDDWEIRAVTHPTAVMLDAVAQSAPDDTSAAWCRQMSEPFIGFWNQRAHDLSLEIHRFAADVSRRLASLMGGSSRNLRLLQAIEPGTRCTRAAAGTWIIGLGYLDPDPFLTLMQQLKDQP